MYKKQNKIWMEGRQFRLDHPSLEHEKNPYTSEKEADWWRRGYHDIPLDNLRTKFILYWFHYSFPFRQISLCFKQERASKIFWWLGIAAGYLLCESVHWLISKI